jgi:IS30 family transposase
MKKKFIDVYKITSRLQNGYTQTEIAKEFNVSHVHIGRILKRANCCTCCGKKFDEKIKIGR